MTTTSTASLSRQDTARNIKAPTSVAEQLAAVPIANRHVDAKPLPDGGGTVEIALVYPRVFAPLIQMLGLRTRKQYLLDPLSWASYLSMDGRRSLHDLVILFAVEQRLSFHEARAIMSSHLTLLMTRRLVVLLPSSPPTS